MGQPWTNRAKQARSDKLFARVLELEVENTDRYGRAVAKASSTARDRLVDGAIPATRAGVPPGLSRVPLPDT